MDLDQQASLDELLRPPFTLDHPTTSDTSSAAITLNVGGDTFTTLRSTLTTQSDFFARMLSSEWQHSLIYVDGNIFVDADPGLFKHVLRYLRSSYPPILWTRLNGFDYALYTALQREAERFGLAALAEWISSQRYLQSITIRQHIEVEEVTHCIRDNVGRYFDNATKHYMPGDFQGKKTNSPMYKRIEVHTTSLYAPVSGWYRYYKALLTVWTRRAYVETQIHVVSLRAPGLSLGMVSETCADDSGKSVE